MTNQNSANELQFEDRGAAVRRSGWILVLVIVGAWIGVKQLWRQGEPQKPITESSYTVNVNQASEMELLNLPDVGPSLAKRILSYREKHGSFRSLSDFSDVPGIGPQTLKQLAPFLSFSSMADAATDDTILTAQSRERIAP